MNNFVDQIMFNPIKGATARLVCNGVENSEVVFNRRPVAQLPSLNSTLSCIYCGRMMYPSAAKQAQHVMAHLIADQCPFQCQFCKVSLSIPDTDWRMIAHLETSHFQELISELRLVQEDSLDRAVSRFFASAVTQMAGRGLHIPRGRAVCCHLCREIIFISERLTVAKHIIAHLDPNEYLPDVTIYNCRACGDKPIGDRSVILDHIMLLPDHRDIPFDRLVNSEEARQLKTLIGQRIKDCFGARYIYGSLCLLRIAIPAAVANRPIGERPIEKSTPPIRCEMNYAKSASPIRARKGKKRSVHSALGAPHSSASCSDSHSPLTCSSRAFVSYSRNQKKQLPCLTESSTSSFNSPSSYMSLIVPTKQTFVSMSEDDVEKSTSPSVSSPSPILNQESVQDHDSIAVVAKPLEAVNAEDIMGAGCFSPFDCVATSIAATISDEPEIIGILPAQSDMQVYCSESTATLAHLDEVDSQENEVTILLTIQRAEAARQKAQRKQKFVGADDDFYADDVNLEWWDSKEASEAAERDAAIVGSDPKIATAVVDSSARSGQATSSSSGVSAEQLLAETILKERPQVAEPDHQVEMARVQTSPEEQCFSSASLKNAHLHIQQKSCDREWTHKKRSPDETDPGAQPRMPFQKNAKERSLFPSPDIFHPAAQAELRESRGDESRILSASRRERKRRLSEVPQPTTPATMTPIVTAAADRISPDSICSLIEFDGEFDPDRLITCSNDSDFLMS